MEQDNMSLEWKKKMRNIILSALISALIAGPVGWAANTFWKESIHPRIDKTVYNGPKIEGPWKTKVRYSDGTFSDLQIKLERNGYIVKGKALCVAGFSLGKRFSFEGTFNSNILTGVYKKDEDSSIERGSLTLQLINNGDAFKGYLSFLDDVANKIMATPVELSRCKTDWTWN